MRITRLNKELQDNSWSDFISQVEKEKDYIDLSAYIAFQVICMMRSKGIKQKELAELLKVKPQQVSKILSGQENPTIDTICRLRRALDMEIDISILGIEKFLNPPVVFANIVEDTCVYFGLTIKHNKGKTVDQHIDEIKPVINCFISNIPISENGDYSMKESVNELNSVIEKYN